MRAENDRRRGKILPSSRRTTGRKWLAVALTALTLLATLSTWHFLTRQGGSDELARVRRENARLRDINRSFERSLQHLQTRLTDQESRINELAIVAGIERASWRVEGVDPSEGGGVGGAFNPYDQVPDLPALEARAVQLDDHLHRVSRGLTERELRLSARPSLSPVRGVISSGYGYRDDPLTGLRAFHRGLDISAPPGNRVFAAADGVVTRAGRFGAQGRVVYIAHGFGYSTRYAHLSKIDVKAGDRVERGDTIGEVGRSGRATGYHVHYEVYEEGQSKNPLEHLLD
ncbi:MAG TPA: M23 family metallopeptidase [Thermoanaerobaculia bacterium]|nr:M23 family metallopeptidase [Thermoanaerobaculia bacterium]